MIQDLSHEDLRKLRGVHRKMHGLDVAVFTTAPDGRHLLLAEWRNVKSDIKQLGTRQDQGPEAWVQFRCGPHAWTEEIWGVPGDPLIKERRPNYTYVIKLPPT